MNKNAYKAWLVFWLSNCLYLTGIAEPVSQLISHAQKYLGDKPDSVSYFVARALQQSSTVNDSGQVYLQVAMTARKIDLQLALTWLDQIDFPQLTDSTTKAKTALLQGFCHYGIRHYVEARQWYEVAQAYYLTSPGMLRIIRQSLGKIYTRDGDYKQALSLYLLNEAYLDSIEDQSKLAEVHIEMGTAYRGQGDTLTAIAYNIKAINNPAISQLYLGVAHANLGHLYSMKRHWKEAEDHLQQAIPIFLNMKFLEELSESYHILGDIYTDQRKFSQAKQTYHKAKKHGAAAWGSFSREAGKLHHSIGKHHLALGQADSALHYFQQALTYVLPQFQPADDFVQPVVDWFYGENTIYLALEGKAQAFQTLFEQSQDRQWLDSALLCHRLITRVEDVLFTGFYGESSKQLLAESSHQRAHEAIKITFQLYQATGEEHYAEQAYFFMEHSKATHLKELFKEIDARSLANIPDSAIHTESRLLKMANQAEINVFEAIASNAPKDTITELIFTQATANETYRSWVQQIRKTYPTYYALTYISDQATVPHIKPYLTQDSLALVHYFLADHELFVLVASSDRTQLFRRPLPDDLPSLIEAFRSNLANLIRLEASQLEQFITDAQQLYQYLWIPDAMTSKRLLVIPDGAIHLLPFDALLSTSVASNTPIQSYPFLLKDHQLTFASSLTTWLDMRNREIDPPVSTFLAVTPETFIEPGLSPFKKNSEDHESMIQLWQGKPLGGLSATKAAFQSAASLYQIIHLFTHAKADDQFPLLSAIFFQKEEKSFEEQVLQLGEILDLDLHADLVAIPTCQSLVGRVLTGEGINSLARAFSLAGCKSMIATLDDVHYQSGLSIMNLFYQYLHQGLPKDQALHQAKLTYLDEASVQEGLPTMWANYVLIGDYSPIHIEKKEQPWESPIPIILIISSLIGIFAFHKNRQK